MNKFLYDYAAEIHQQNVYVGWWNNKDTGQVDIDGRNRPLIWALIISEMSEAWTGLVANLNDDHLPRYDMFSVEIADTFIRLADLVGADVLPYLDEFGTIAVVDPANLPVDYDSTFQLYRDFNGTFVELVNFISAGLEGFRKEKMDIYRANILKAYEFIFDFAAHTFGFNRFVEIVEAKREYNRNRPDHKVEARMKEGGKKF